MLKNNKIYFLGDSHGVLPKNLPTDSYIYHVGDVGLGFPKHTDPVIPNNMYYIHGNHDNPKFICNNYLGRFGTTDFNSDINGFFIGGEYSLDKYLRIEGRDWWPEEELSYKEQMECLDLYLEKKPDVIMSHGCPLSIIPSMNLKPVPTSTNKLLDHLWELHKPKLWIFGHFHLNFDRVILDTRFICLNINELKEITL